MRICRGVYLGLALFGLLAHLLLGLGGSVAPLWLPACLGAGVGLGVAVSAGLLRRQGTFAEHGHGSDPGARTWVLAGTVVAILVVCVAFVLDVTRMPPHDWDAVAAWSVKTRRLLADPSLGQPFFEDPAVWHHSRDYPLLQPLCLASSEALVGEGPARLCFVMLYLLMVGTAGFAARAAGAGRDAACAAAAGLGLTPILVDPTGGGFTSGYADAFLATAVTGAAAGLLLRDGWLLAAATVLLVLLKPEGLIYGGLVVAVAWLKDQRGLLFAAVAGFVLAAGVWLPIQLALQHARLASPAWTLWPSLLCLGAILVLAQRWIRPEERPAWLLALLVVLAAVLFLVLVKLLVAGMGQQQGSLTTYFQDLGRVVDRLPRLPQILWGVVSYLFLLRKVGLLFVFLLAWGILGRRLPQTSPAGASALWLLLALATPCLVMPYLLSHEHDLAHHMRSSMGRLLLHWLGAGWLLAGLGAGQVLAQAAAHDPQDQRVFPTPG